MDYVLVVMVMCRTIKGLITISDSPVRQFHPEGVIITISVGQSHPEGVNH